METVPLAVLVVDDDLMFSVRIETGLKKMGYAPTVAVNADDALTSAQSAPPVLAIVNFGSEKFAPAVIVERLKALPNPPIVLGFVSHVWMPQVRPNAVAAGVDMLVANSALSMRLPQLVTKLLNTDQPSST